MVGRGERGGCRVLVDAPLVKLSAPPIDELLPQPRPWRLLKFGCFREGGDRSCSSCSEAATDSFTAGVAALIVSECSLCRNETFSENEIGWSATKGAAQPRHDPHIKGGTNVAAANELAAVQLHKKV